MTDPRTPSTEAGRRLMRSTETQDDGTWSGLDLTAFRDGILAIEAEASTLASSERLAAALHAALYEEHRKYVTHPEAEDCDVCELLNADPALSDPDAERQRAIGERLPSRVWSWVHQEMRAEGVSDEHAMARADVIRIEVERWLAAALPAAQEPERP
jgi:hypothetical protein